MASYEITREELIRHTYIVAGVENEDDAFDTFAAGDYDTETTEISSVNDDSTAIQKISS